MLPPLFSICKILIRFSMYSFVSFLSCIAVATIESIICPECQGTGIHVEGEELENPTISLSEVWRST
jgi:hypothetical protein